MNSASKPFQAVLFCASLSMLAVAAVVWTGKTRRALPVLPVDLPTESSVAAPRLSPMAGRNRQALALLARSYRADNTLSYSAQSRTTAWVGGEKVESVARVTRAPRHLSVRVLSGAMAGSQSGYSQHWLWRQNAGERVKPYAEIALDADQMAAHRFDLLDKNYAVTEGRDTVLDGRRAQVLELRPLHLIDGATGPARRLFIDTQSGLTLRIDAFNCALKPVSQTEISQLNLAPQITPVTFEAPALIKASLHGSEWQGEEMAQNRLSAAKKTGFMPPQPKFLPPGFQLDGYGVHRCRTTGALQLSAFSRYTDGLNTLTVFAFKPSNANIQKTMRGTCNFGPGAMSSREDGGGRLVALGDLPTKTLQRVLTSAKFETAK